MTIPFRHTRTRRADFQRKLSVITAALGTTLATIAQADVTFIPAAGTQLSLFGSVDYSLAYQDKNGGPGNSYAPTNQSWAGVNGGGDSTNKFGVKGEYTKADYTLGFNFSGTASTNSGSAGNTSPALNLFNQSFNFYIRNSTGTYTVGEQMDPAWLATIRGDNRGAPQSLDPIAGVWSVAQGTQSTPQADMGPTNALSYANKFGSTSLGLLYKPYSNQSGAAGLQTSNDAGSQASIGAIYDDGTYLATAGYIVHHGIGGTQSTNVDIENQSVSLGYKAATWSVKGGYLLSNSPVGIATGNTIFAGWNASAGPLNQPSAIQISHIGMQFNQSEKNQISATYYAAKDRLNGSNTANWLVFGDHYKVDTNLTLYANLGTVFAGAGANPLTAGTGPNNVAKPNDTTTQINTGFTFVF